MGNSQQVEMTPEIKAILDLSKARTLAAKMESQQTERDLAKKVRDEQDAYRIKQERKEKVAQNAKLAKSKNAIKMLDTITKKLFNIDTTTNKISYNIKKDTINKIKSIINFINNNYDQDNCLTEISDSILSHKYFKQFIKKLEDMHYDIDIRFNTIRITWKMNKENVAIDNMFTVVAISGISICLIGCIIEIVHRLQV